MASFLSSWSKEGAVRYFGESNLLSGLGRIIVPAAVFLCTATLVAQKTQDTIAPKYDVHTEAKMKGTVEEVRLPPKGSEKVAVHLLVKIGTDTIDLYLCPKSFLDEMGVTFAKGEEIALTGSRVKEGEANLVLAREVVRGTDTLVFRDEKGKPVWT
jgi:hypothetical protein